MFQQFKQYIKANKLINKGERVVVALSGGIDSVVLTHLLAESGIEIVAAHCNFHLRGEESDSDERFVIKFCNNKGVKCHVKHFDTEAYAKTQGLSIEMAARELRYNWFDELRKELDFDKIAVAHHADDQIETFFINLLRGSGIHGLKAMLPQNGNIVRPLLWATRQEINDYAVAHNLKWRNDSTNEQTIYTRNKLRNIIIPEIDNNFANARHAITQSINYLSSESSLYDELVNQHIKALETRTVEAVTIAKSAFEGINGKQLLFEWIKRYGFNTSQSEFIAEALQKTGTHFLSPTHRLCIERDKLVINILPKEGFTNIIIGEEQTEISSPTKMSFTVVERTPDFSISHDPRIAMIDLDKINYPLTLRTWRHGDRFKPLGMKGTKLVSDLLVSLHLTQVEKDNSYVIEDSTGAIVWVVGKRLDDRFKVTEKTKRILVIS